MLGQGVCSGPEGTQNCASHPHCPASFSSQDTQSCPWEGVSGLRRGLSLPLGLGFMSPAPRFSCQPRTSRWPPLCSTHSSSVCRERAGFLEPCQAPRAGALCVLFTAQGPAHSRCSIQICWMNKEWVKDPLDCSIAARQGPQRGSVGWPSLPVWQTGQGYLSPVAPAGAGLSFQLRGKSHFEALVRARNSSLVCFRLTRARSDVPPFVGVSPEVTEWSGEGGRKPGPISFTKIGPACSLRPAWVFSPPPRGVSRSRGAGFKKPVYASA